MTETTVEKSAHVLAVERFLLADKEYRTTEEAFLDGTTLIEITSLEKTVEGQRSAWRSSVDKVKTLLEKRNSALKEAQNTLRSSVQLSGVQERGADGKPTILHEGPFTVVSVTHRTFDPEDLLNLCTKHKIVEELRTLKTACQDGGEKPAFEQVWKMDYEAIRNWLIKKDLGVVLRSAYEEVEKTPQVKGPKKLAFLGERISGDKPE